MTAPPRPPRLAEAIVQALVADPALREAALGDLAEEYALVAGTRGLAAARGWYWSQVVRSAASLSMLGMTPGIVPWLRVIGSIVLGYVLLAAMVMEADFWLRTWLGGAGAPPWLLSVASLTAGVACAVVTGHVNAMVAGRVRVFPAAALGVLCVAISAFLLAHGGDGSPLWYQVALMVVVLPSLVLGALLRAWRESRRRRRWREPLPSSSPEQH